MRNKSPLITQLDWGHMVVERIGSGKDFKLWPGGGREWDWSETGTHHMPGIQPVDIAELLEHGANEIILSRGILLALHTCKETEQLLSDKKISYHIIETKKAMNLYNSLASQGRAIGGLFHSTC